MDYTMDLKSLYEKTGGKLSNGLYITCSDGYYDLHDATRINLVMDGETVTVIDESDGNATFITQYDDKVVMAREDFAKAVSGYIW